MSFTHEIVMEHVFNHIMYAHMDNSNGYDFTGVM